MFSNGKRATSFPSRKITIFLIVVGGMIVGTVSYLVGRSHGIQSGDQFVKNDNVQEASVELAKLLGAAEGRSKSLPILRLDSLEKGDAERIYYAASLTRLAVPMPQTVSKPLDAVMYVNNYPVLLTLIPGSVKQIGMNPPTMTASDFWTQSSSPIEKIYQEQGDRQARWSTSAMRESARIRELETIVRTAKSK
jgi:hypothetical protein